MRHYRTYRTVKIFAPGSDACIARVRATSLAEIRIGGLSWSECGCCADLAEVFDASEDDIKVHDVYWGGEYGDANSVDAVVIRGEIVATFGSPITLDDLAAIYANALPSEHYPEGCNNHARLVPPSPVLFLQAAE